MSGETLQAARGKWRGILTTLGLDPNSLTGKHGPCPLCNAGKDRFRWDDKDGEGTYYCSACGHGTGMQLLMAYRGWGFPRAAFEVDGIIGAVKVEAIKTERTDADKAKALQKLLKASGKVQPGTAAWIYLENRCGDPRGILGDLWCHPGLKHTDGGTWPAMLAVLRYADGKGASVHRTFLTPDGYKAPVDPVRMMMPGFSLEGSAVRFSGPQERLGIAEGIETAICAGKLFGLPVWAGISANGMKAWDPPEGCRSVLICGDNDRSYTGQSAAFELARRLRVKGLDVEVVIPQEIDADWADVWMAQQRVEVA